jgi:predicted TPR repeat methyltransferase
VLRRSLRYAHDEAALQAMASGCGLAWRASGALALRLDEGRPVDGRVIVLGATG